ncbi:hypothetical protein PIIN_06565 [Serendipita indica DSM 11827]|uniref:Hemerythrin-like domain-containing protein n=1 Tax=Serendipita indica (strain DSM 11827) TaxID=1109443 RepID=G4TMT5_SERID|nr:hypothetical protein PIIN_06565 [Serendipita indica DSM 11827]
MPNPAVIARFERSRALFRAECAKPEPADLFDRQSWAMAGVHLILVESMLSTYQKAESIAPKDEQAFGFYALVTIGGVVTHHREEEEEYIPRLQPELVTPIVDEHHLFIGPLHELEEYLLSFNGLKVDKSAHRYIPSGQAKGTRPKYDGKRIAETIEKFSEPMLEHLEHELTYISGDNLRKCKLPLSKLEQWTEYERTILTKMDPFIAPVFVVGHTPPNSHFPPLPFGFRQFLIPYVFWWKHRKAWKFIPPQERL